MRVKAAIIVCLVCVFPSTSADTQTLVFDFETYYQAYINNINNVPETVSYLDMSEEFNPGQNAENCLAEAIYFESRGESILGQLAVARVIINRALSSQYPNTLCAVINQKAQFSYKWDKHPDDIDDKKAWDTALTVAQLALSIIDSNDFVGVTHYHTIEVNPVWARAYETVKTVDNHIFYRTPRGI